MQETFLNVNNCLLKEEYRNLRQMSALYCASFFGDVCICEQAFSLINLNKSAQRNGLRGQNFTSTLRLLTKSNMPHFNLLASTVQGPVVSCYIVITYKYSKYFICINLYLH
jgi:hypothetical protein